MVYFPNNKHASIRAGLKAGYFKSLKLFTVTSAKLSKDEVCAPSLISTQNYTHISYIPLNPLPYIYIHIIDTCTHTHIYIYI